MLVEKIFETISEFHSYNSEVGESSYTGLPSSPFMLHKPYLDHIFKTLKEKTT